MTTLRKIYAPPKLCLHLNQSTLSAPQIIMIIKFNYILVILKGELENLIYEETDCENVRTITTQITKRAYFPYHIQKLLEGQRNP